MMTAGLEISEVGPTDFRLGPLAAEARAEGYAFMDRLMSEARTGANCFDKVGEVFCGALYKGRLVGCGGVNIDPYADRVVGRLRHIYVLKEFRRMGVATGLVQTLLERSRLYFETIRLRTPDEGAGRFYEAIGFTRTAEEAATHFIQS